MGFKPMTSIKKYFQLQEYEERKALKILDLMAFKPTTISQNIFQNNKY